MATNRGLPPRSVALVNILHCMTLCCLFLQEVRPNHYIYGQDGRVQQFAFIPEEAAEEGVSSLLVIGTSADSIYAGSGGMLGCLRVLASSLQQLAAHGPFASIVWSTLISEISTQGSRHRAHP